jgi:transposase-like protein
VSIPSKVLKPRQRIWDDVALQVHQWGKLALSLRQMQRALSDALHTSVGLRTLNERLQALKGRLPGQGELQAVPPVVVLDAIWVTLLVETGQYKRDKRGRLRSVKRKKRVAVLIALGVWPRSGRSTVLDWELAAGESRPDWEGLLSRLSQRRLWKERGLRLFIHDGGKGLRSALKTWYWEVPSQRCVFHKLRNVWQAIVVPDDYSPKQSRHLKRRIIHQAAAIFQAADEQAARKRLAAFRDRWRDTQPEAAQVLSRDLQDTLCFYTFLRTHPDWRPECLRTTSALERLNRKLRRPFRAACAYHSGEGLLAAASRVLSPLLA